MISAAVSGLQVGAIYALMALGLYTVFSSTKVLNLTQGAFAVFGAMLISSSSVLAGAPLWIAWPLALVGGGILGGLVDVAIIRPLYRPGDVTFVMIVATLAGWIGLTEVAGLLWSKDYFAARSPVGAGGFTVGEVIIWHQGIFVLAFVLLSYWGFWLFQSRTNHGRQLRAVGVDREAAALIGVNIAKTDLVAFVVAGVFGAAAGALYAPLNAASVFVGSPLLISGLIAYIVGGQSSPVGGLVGGMAVGLIEQFATRFAPTEIVPLITVVALIVVLAVAPKGLASLGRSQRVVVR